MSSARARVAADIGGTFTDIALIHPDGRIATRKVPSTPNDYGGGVIEGIRQILTEERLGVEDVDEVLHACTVANGTYHFVDHLDGLGRNPVPIVFDCALTVLDETIRVDWTGSSKQVGGGINTPLPFTKACVYTALRSVMLSDIPNCHGFTRAIEVTAPKGTIVNSVYPAPTGARGITGYRICSGPIT